MSTILSAAATSSDPTAAPSTLAGAAEPAPGPQLLSQLCKLKTKDGYTALHIAALDNASALCHALLTAQPGLTGGLKRTC